MKLLRLTIILLVVMTRVVGYVPDFGVFLSDTCKKNGWVYYQYPVKNTAKNEISFCIADLKYDGTSVKVCELGAGLESQFKGFDHLYGKGAAWSLVWHMLASLKKPMWFVDHNGYRDSMMAISDFEKLGGTYTNALSSVEKHDTSRLGGLRPKTNKSGIFAIKHMAQVTAAIQQFKANHPDAIVLNEATDGWVKNKYKTNTLFLTSPLEQFRPKWNVYPKKYTPELADIIIRDLGSSFVVIKPIDASLGHGVIMVEKAELDATLRLILRDRDALSKLKSIDLTHRYWLSDKNDIFLAEAYAPSKIITVDGKHFDPTMRVMFVLINQDGTAHACFLGGYWKLPSYAIDENVSLTKKHKSHVDNQKNSAVAVDHGDFVQVTRLLGKPLGQVYTAMLDAWCPSPKNEKS